MPFVFINDKKVLLTIKISYLLESAWGDLHKISSLILLKYPPIPIQPVVER